MNASARTKIEAGVGREVQVHFSHDEHRDRLAGAGGPPAGVTVAQPERSLPSKSPGWMYSCTGRHWCTSGITSVPSGIIARGHVSATTLPEPGRPGPGPSRPGPPQPQACQVGPGHRRDLSNRPSPIMIGWSNRRHLVAQVSASLSPSCHSPGKLLSGCVCRDRPLDRPVR